MIDTASGGTLNSKTPEAAYELIDEMAINSYRWQIDRSTNKKLARVHNVNVVTALTAQIKILNKKIDGISVEQVLLCDLCGASGHKSVECQVVILLLNPLNKWIMQKTSKDHHKITPTLTHTTLEGGIILIFHGQINQIKDHLHQD